MTLGKYLLKVLGGLKINSVSQGVIRKVTVHDYMMLHSKITADIRCFESVVSLLGSHEGHSDGNERPEGFSSGELFCCG